MRIAKGAVTLALIWGAATGCPASAAPIDTLVALRRHLANCTRLADPDPAWSGSEMTVRFSLRRDGQLIGQPAITYSRLPGAGSDQKPFVAAALAALATCFPVPVTPGLGGAIAGRILTSRIGVGRPVPRGRGA